MCGDITQALQRMSEVNTQPQLTRYINITQDKIHKYFTPPTTYKVALVQLCPVN